MIATQRFFDTLNKVEVVLNEQGSLESAASAKGE
jgi:hypothetical protein